MSPEVTYVMPVESHRRITLRNMPRTRTRSAPANTRYHRLPGTIGHFCHKMSINVLSIGGLSAKTHKYPSHLEPYLKHRLPLTRLRRAISTRNAFTYLLYKLLADSRDNQNCKQRVYTTIADHTLPRGSLLHRRQRWYVQFFR